MKICTALLFLLLPHLKAHAKLNDVQVVTLTLLGEGRGEGKIGLQAIACVIQNRALAAHTSPREICLARKQFSFWNGGVRKSVISELFKCKQEPFAWELANKLVKGIRLHDITGRATHYHAISCRPNWAEPRFRTCEIKNHRFYRIV